MSRPGVAQGGRVPAGGPRSPSCSPDHQRAEEPGQQDHILQTRAGVTDAQLHRGQMGRGADIEVDHARVGYDLAPHQVGHGPVVVRGRPEPAWGTRGSPAPPRSGCGSWPSRCQSRARRASLPRAPSSAGIPGATWCATATAKSRSFTSTCTCMPQINCSRTSLRYSPRMCWYRGSEVTSIVQ